MGGNRPSEAKNSIGTSGMSIDNTEHAGETSESTISRIRRRYQILHKCFRSLGGGASRSGRLRRAEYSPERRLSASGVSQWEKWRTLAAFPAGEQQFALHYARWKAY